MLTNSYNPQDALNLVNDLRKGFAAAGLDRITNVSAKSVINLKPTEGVNIAQTLTRTSKKYIVPFNGKFYVYSLRLEEHPTSKDLFKMVQPVPNIYREGIVCYGNKFYFVKLEDLKRGIVRKSRKLPVPAKRTVTYQDLINGLACTNFADLPDEHPQSAASIALRRAGVSISPATIIAPAEGSGNQESPGSTESAQLDEELRLADMAFEGQIHALYDSSDPEEGWIDPSYS